MEKKELYIVGVGASAGGHEALKEFFTNIPTDLPAAFVVVTHLLRNYKSELASIITRFTKLKVSRLSGMTRPEAGRVYVMPEDVIAYMKDGHLVLKQRPAEQNINRSIDIFFESLAEDQRNRAIGVVLSGMGFDGSNGALRLYEKGGDVLVQEPSTTKFNSMPWATIMKDHPDYILPPKELGRKLAELIQSKALRVAS